MRRPAIAMFLLCMTSAFGPSYGAGPSTPYDALHASYAPYLNPADPLAWPAKVRAVARDEYHYWRGTRDLFYAWCGEHCRDWVAAKGDYVVSQGDLHLGNFGAYATAPFGTVAYGLVDFDDSARLPFELELLQGVITFDLVARQNGIDLPSDRRAALHAALFDAYADASARPDADTGLSALLPSRKARPYADDLKRFTDDGRFRTRVTKKAGDVTDELRPIAPGRRDALADAIAEAVRHDARLATLLRPRNAGQLRDAILDAADRTRLDSSGSQGLSKVLVLLRRPFRGSDDDGILYLKQQVPSAAERAGLVPPDPRSPAERSVRDLDALTHSRSLAASWCAWEGRDYWVSVKEPWGVEVDDKAIKDFAGLTAAARAWSRVLADAHAADAARLAAAFTPGLREAVAERADAFLADEAGAYARFRDDPRTRQAVAAFEAAALP